MVWIVGRRCSCNLYPEAESVAKWLKGGWYVAIAYVIGFAVMLNVLGWRPAESTSQEYGDPLSPNQSRFQREHERPFASRRAQSEVL